MRVVTTSMYFEYDDVRGYQGYRRRLHLEDRDRNPGISLAWFAGDTAHPPDFSNYKIFQSIEFPFRPDFVKGALDLFVRDVHEPGFLQVPPDNLLENPRIIDFVFNEGIVIERSPPILISLKGLLNNTNSPLWIGSFAGSMAAWDHPMLLLITVPGGILAVSSAYGIATALQGGLNKAIKRLFDRN